MFRRSLILAILLALAWSWPAGAQTVNVPEYSFDVTLDPVAKRAVVRQSVSFVNSSSKPLPEIFFHVYPNRVYSPREQKLMMRYTSYFKVNVFPDGFPKDVVRLERVHSDGQTLTYEWQGEDRTLLKVGLPQPVAPGESVQIAFDFELRLPHAYSRFGWNENIIKLSQWYPLLAMHDEQGWHNYPFYPFHRPFFSAAAKYSVRLTVPSEQVVIHTGVVDKETRDDRGNKILNIFTPLPVRDFTMAVSADYKLLEGRAGGVKIKSYYLPGDEQSGRMALESAQAVMEFYSRMLGPYPYPEYSIAPVHLGYGGEQMSNMAFIDTRAYRLPGLLKRYFDFIVAHETGHQWFYNVIGVDEYTQMWLEEGVNSYFILQYLEKKYGPHAEVLDFPQWARAGEWVLPKLYFYETRDYLYKRMVRIGYGKQPVLGSLSRFREPSSIFYLAYGKGERIVEMLKTYIGPEAFERVFRRIWREKQYGVLDIAYFRRICEEESGQKLDWFFDQWLLGPGYFDYAVAGAGKGKITLERKGEIKIPATVRIKFKDGQTQELLWAGEDKRKDITLTSKSPVVQAVIDPEHELLDIDRTNNCWPRRIAFKPVPYYWGFYDVPIFQKEDSYNIIVGPEVQNGGLGIKAAIMKPYDQILYAGTDYSLGESLQHSRVGYMLRNVFRSQTSLGVELANTTDYHDGSEDVASGKIFLRRELWPSAYSFSEVNDHVTLYLVRNQRLSDRNQFWEYREQDVQLEYSRRREAIVGAALKLDQSGPYPDPVKGYQLKTWSESGGHFLGATQYFYRNAFDASFYQPVTKHSRLALRASYGWGFPNDKDLYQLGGMMNLRGYDYKRFHGANMLLNSAEYRFPIVNDLDWSFFDNIIGLESVGGVVFFDGASTWFAEGDAQKWKKDAGAGLRFTVNFASMLEKVIVRFDVAQPLNGEAKDTHFWLGLNHAF